MKKIILALTVLAVAAAGLQNAKAGDREWAVTGKILTGLVVASAINHAIADDHCRTVVYSAPAPVVYCPPPRVFYSAPVYCAPPPPVVAYRAPVCYAPTPVVSFRFGYGDHRHYRRGCW